MATHRAPWHVEPCAPRSSLPSATRPPTRRPLVPREVFLYAAPTLRPRERSDGPARLVPRLRHHAARRRAAGGPQPLRRRQADDRPAARRARASATSRAAGRAPTPRTPSSSAGPRTSSTCSTPSSRPSAPPAGPASPRPTTRWSRRCATAAPRVVTLVAKSHDRHVELALRTTLEENLAMVRDTVTHLRAEGQRVFLDAEHFFDGYRANRDYALEVLRTAYEAGAEVVALCDTNGGMLPDWVADVVHDVVETTGARVGIHCPQRHRLRGRQHAGRGRRRRHPRAGPHQRVRRAHRQRRPRHRRRQPRAQAGPAGAAGRAARRGHPDRARGRRGHQLPAGVAPAVRRRLGVRAQGRPARQRDQGRPQPLPAHGPGRRRQRHAAARLRHGRPRLDRAQGPRARLRPLRATASWSPG